MHAPHGAQDPASRAASPRARFAPRVVGDEIALSVGGVVGQLVFSGASPAFLERVLARYDAFWLPPTPSDDRAFALRLAMTSAPSPTAADLTADALARPLVVTESPTSLSIARWDFEAQLAPDRTCPGSWSGEGRCEANPFALDSLLRVLWSVFLPRAGGALLHACGLRRGDIALVFPGPSGAGKTTLARKADPDQVLSDEIVAVGRGAGGSFRAWGTPFWGELQRGGTSLRSFSLRGLSFLEQSDQIAVHPLAPAEALQRLLACFVCFQSDRATVERNVQIAAALCAEVPLTVLCSTLQTPARAALDAAVLPLGSEADAPSAPANAREAISELRALLGRHGTYVFEPTGGSMRPYLRSGDAAFIEAADEDEVAIGDVLLYWTRGRTPAEDTLTCHRLLGRVPSTAGTRFFTKGDALTAIGRFENRRNAELLGKVCARWRSGGRVRVPGRIENVAWLAGSLAILPIRKLLGR